MTTRYREEMLDSLLAPGYSAFTAAVIPDLRAQFPEAPHWPANFLLNSIFGARYKLPFHTIVLGFLRRAHHGFAAYHSAADATARFLDGKKPGEARAVRFYEALGYWETFALDMNTALDLCRWLSGGVAVFQANDGSREQRLYDCANRVKHLRGQVEAGKHDTVPLWLSNDGLVADGLQVSWVEASEVLADTARLADTLQNPRTTLPPPPSAP